MTVSELVEVLKEKPQDLVVLYRFASDWDVLTAEDVRVEEVSFRAGEYRTRYSPKMYGPNEVPEYRTCLTLPGN